MKTSQVTYLGELRTTNTHLRSGETYITDAPVDNNGKGEAFSPTDLVATALADCLITILSMKATTMGYDFKGTVIDVEKIMSASPRRIAEIVVDIKFPKLDISDQDKKVLEKVATLCPVAQSLHPDVIQTINFNWQ